MSRGFGRTPSPAPSAGVCATGSCADSETGIMLTVRRAALGTAVVAMTVAVTLAGCTSTQPPRQAAAPKPSASARATPAAALSTVSFCVGTSPKHPSGSTVTVRFMRGPLALGEPVIQVPMRVSVQVSAGPFTVVVDGAPQLTGSLVPGGTVLGAMGRDCPS